MRNFDDEEEEVQPTKGKFVLPKIKLPDIRKTLRKIKLPTVDVGILVGGMAISLISAGASVMAVRFFLPEKKVEIVNKGEQQAYGESFNPLGAPGFTVGPNVNTAFVTHISRPTVERTSHIHPQASVIGAVEIGHRCYVGPQASIRGDEGQGIRVGNESAVLDAAILHGPPTEHGGILLERNQVNVLGQRYSIYLGDRVTMAPQSQVYGPAIVGDDTFIGQQSLVNRSLVGKRCVLEPRAAIIGVRVKDGRFVPAGVVVRTQAEAEQLPVITGDYPLRDVNSQAVEVNKALAEGYNSLYPNTGASPDAGH